MASSGSTYIPWSKVTETVLQGVHGVMTSNMIWGKTPPPLCDFVQWLDTEQSQQDKDHVERQVRWAAQS